MDAQRRTKKNKLKVDIATARTAITRAEATIGRIRGSKMGAGYVLAQTDKLNALVEEKLTLVATLEDEMRSVISGERDDEIASDIKKSTTEVAEKHARDKAEKATKRSVKEQQKTTREFT